MNNELKTYSAHIFELGCMNQRVYLKAEADKVISEKDTKIIQLEALIENYNRISREIIDNANHQKYKRCMKIAERCFESREYWRYRYGDWSDKGYDRTYKWRKVEFWGSWGRRWLELAEKFKDGK